MQPPKKRAHLFVYGTLRRNGGNKNGLILAKHAEFISNASYQGKLYKISTYPAVVPSCDVADIVFGEVYRLFNPSYVLPLLDDYEECGPNFAKPTEYIRKTQHVQLVTGAILPVWIYLYNRPTACHKPIKSGDYLNAPGQAL